MPEAGKSQVAQRGYGRRFRCLRLWSIASRLRCRAVSPKNSQRFVLEPAPPSWCVTTHKWPPDLAPATLKVGIDLGIYVNCTTGQCDPGNAVLAKASFLPQSNSSKAPWRREGPSPIATIDAPAASARAAADLGDETQRRPFRGAFAWPATNGQCRPQLQ